MTIVDLVEEIEVRGLDLIKKVGELIRQGNITRIVVKDKNGATFAEIPATIGTVGIILAPLLIALGTLTALVANFKIVVERTKPKKAASDPPRSASVQRAK